MNNKDALKFIPGIKLCENYYQKIIAPLMQRFKPGLPYSAGLLGYGSDVIGTDNPTSMDHNWGPRLQVLLNNRDLELAGELKDYFRATLPAEFMGFSTNYSNPAADGTSRMVSGTPGDINHLIEIYSIDDFFSESPAIDRSGSRTAWLGLPEQLLDVLKRFGFNKKLRYIGSELRSKKSLQLLKDNKIPFSLSLTIECFSRREELIRAGKNNLNLDETINILEMANKLGFATNILYITGLESLDILQEKFKIFLQYMNRFPVVQIFQNFIRYYPN